MTFIDFFSGIGGFRVAFEMAGHVCLGHCEIDKYADRSYREMFEIKPYEWYGKDITKVEPSELPDADVFVGGFPCQAFSIAGKGLGFEDTRGTLIFELLRLAKERKPKILVLENVKRLITHDKGRTFATILNGLCELGYSVEWQVLNSKDFGVPQNRERVFIVASLGGKCTGEIFPIFGTSKTNIKQIVGGTQGRRIYDSDGCAVTITAEGGGKGGRSGLYAVNSEKQNAVFIDMVQGAPKTTETARCLISRYNGGVGNRNLSSGVLVSDNEPCPVITPARENKRQKGRRFKNSDEPMFTITGQDIHGIAYVKNATKKGFDVAYEGDSINLAFPNSKNRRGRVGKGVAQTLDTSCNQGVLSSNVSSLYTDDSPTWHKAPLPGLSRCLKANNHDAAITDGFRIRKLTPLECWRLQGFPDELFFKAKAVNSDNQLYKQAGNSVTVNVVCQIAKRLKELEYIIMEGG